MRLEPFAATVVAKMAGPSTPVNFSKMAKNAKNSADL